MQSAEKRSQAQRREVKRSGQYLLDYPAIRGRLQEIKAEAEQALIEIDKQEQEDVSLRPEAVEIGLAFKAAADQLLTAVDQTLAEMRAEREKTRKLLDRLEGRLVSHG
jgi:cytochrome c556